MGRAWIGMSWACALFVAACSGDDTTANEKSSGASSGTNTGSTAGTGAGSTVGAGAGGASGSATGSTGATTGTSATTGSTSSTGSSATSATAGTSGASTGTTGTTASTAASTSATGSDPTTAGTGGAAGASGGTGGAAGTSGDAGTSAPRKIGGGCKADADCDTTLGLHCDLKPTGGLCTKACVVDGDCGNTTLMGMRAGNVCVAMECYRGCSAAVPCTVRNGWACIGTEPTSYCGLQPKDAGR